MSFTVRNVTARITEMRMDILPECKTNAYVINGDKASYVIDTGFGSETANELLRHCRPGLDIFVINTHFHWDHVWGNAFFPDSKVVCHARCKESMYRSWERMERENGRYKRGEIKLAPPALTFDSKLELHGEVFLFHSPGHTDDCIGIHFPADSALFVGDNFGDTDAQLLPELECSREVFLSSLNDYRKCEADRFLSGHNEEKRTGILEAMIDLL